MFPNIRRKKLMKEKSVHDVEVLSSKYHVKLFRFSPGPGASMTKEHVHDPWIRRAHT